LAAAGGCALPPPANDRRHWALLSDIHIAADPNLIHLDANMTRNLQAVTAEIIADPSLPSSMLVNGDLAFSSGEAADYSAIVGLLRPLREAGLPIHLALGNHDHRERFWTTLRSAKSVQPILPQRQVAIVRTPDANWFVLDSLIRTLETAGQLGDAQRAWLAQALDDNAGKPALIFIHHHPNLPQGTQGGPLQDTPQLLDILRPRRQVKAYFFGHTHRWGLSQDPSGLHLVNLPPVAYLFEKGRPNGWVRATLQTDGVRLELRCLDRAHKDHGQIADLAWRA
jgi:3',5'-cyclic AMP phosphodiesterase CpdA